MNKDYTDQKQKLAVCYSAWKRRKAKAAFVVQAGGEEYAIDASQARPNRLHVPENWDRIDDLSTKDYSCWAGANDWEDSWTGAAFVFGSGPLGSYTRRVWAHIRLPEDEVTKAPYWSDHGKGVVTAWCAAAQAARDARARPDYQPGYGPEDFTDTAPQIEGLTGWGVERVQWVAAKPVDLNNGDPANPDNSNAPSRDLPMRGSDNAEKKAHGEDVESKDDDSAKPNLDDMQWYMGGLEAELDPKTGLAKWPLSFKVIKRDVDKGKKGYKPTPASPQSVEMAPRAV